MVKLGTTLYLELSKDGKTEKYKTNIAEIKDNEIFVEIPINEKTKKFGFFHLNTIFQAFYYESGKVYNFSAELLRRKKENIPLLVLSFPGEEDLRVIQRRQYVRVESALDVAIHPLNNEFPPFSTVTIDISGGGIAVHMPKDYGLVPDQEVDIWMVLPMLSGQYAYCKMRCSVVRLFYVRDTLRASFKYAHIKEREHQKIIRYTLDKDLYYQRLKK